MTGKLIILCRHIRSKFHQGAFVSILTPVCPLALERSSSVTNERKSTRIHFLEGLSKLGLGFFFLFPFLRVGRFL